jgi:hypothetical protein
MTTALSRAIKLKHAARIMANFPVIGFLALWPKSGAVPVVFDMQYQGPLRDDV